mmetsp:Transcript_3226/g.7135  ORF Transcript_3226/g.7135 Transcript_3226/m.7135 type:complete len:1869 (+) Transcript_3226:634-6240(+)
MTDNNNAVPPSTPSWMTDQRNQRRANRRGYGRRYSGVGPISNSSGGSGATSTFGIRSTATKQNKRRDSALFARSNTRGSTLNFDNGGEQVLDIETEVPNAAAAEEDHFLDHSAHARLQGNRGLGRPPRGPNGGVDSLDQSVPARLENDQNLLLPCGNNENANAGAGLDLMDEFEQHIRSKAKKKKRPNLPRPPRAVAVAATASSSRATRATAKASSSSFQLFPSTPKSHYSNESKETMTSTSSSSTISGSQDNPISLLGEEDGTAPMQEEVAPAKRSKVMMSSYHRSDSAIAVATAAKANKASLLSEENVHPNDTTETPVNSSVIGTRRSSRLASRRASVAGLSSSSNSETKTPAVTTRSRAKANSKKRSATSASTDTPAGGKSNGNSEQLEPSPPKIATQSSMKSFSSRSFSSSCNSSTSIAANNSISSSTSESFSSLARRSSCQNWASGKKKSYHQRSVSVASSANNGSSNSALKTPSAASASSLHHRSISCGNDLLSDNMKPAYSPSFLSPESGGGGGTNLSTPSEVGSASSSSRKRRTMNYTGSSPNDDDLLGGSERTRLKKSPPMAAVPFVMDYDATCEFAPASSSRTTAFMSHSEPHNPMDIFSPPTASSFGNSRPLLNDEMSLFMSDDDNNADEKKLDNSASDHRLSFENDESMMSTESSDDENISSAKSTTSDDEEDDDASDDEDEKTPRQMTDAEIFQSKSSYDDFKFLTKSLQRWSSRSSSTGKGIVASMGLNNGCLIAVPPSWTFEHRANFGKWVVTSFGFRVGSVGGADRGSFLRCSDGEGREVLGRLRRILNEYKAGRLILLSTNEETIGAGGKAACASRNNGELEVAKKPKAKLPIKPSSAQRSCSFSFNKKGRTTLPISPFCDSMVGELLADDMKGITLDETKKPPPRKKSHSNNNGRNSSVPNFIRSMTLQPLANKIKNTTLPCFRNLSPTVGRSSGGVRLPRLSAESAINGSDFINQLHGMGSPSPLPKSKCLTMGGGGENGHGRRSSGNGGRLPRLSSESAIIGSNFINQLHGMGSPSPLPKSKCFPRRLRALQPTMARQPSLETLRTSFEMDLPSQHHQHQGCLQPFESPHPRNNCLALETPSSRLEIGLETPMPKQVENWGSRPVFGKDWGESLCCCDGTIDACTQIFAKSWFTSDFYDEDELSAQYGMTFDEEDESFLFEFYDADANIDDDDDDDDDSELASINGNSLDEFPTSDFMSTRIGFARCDSVGASALDLLRLDDKVKDSGQSLSPAYDRRRTMKLRKYARMSLCVAAASDFLQPKLKGCYRLSESPAKKQFSLKGTPINSIMGNSTVFSHVLSFLNEGELIHSASLISTRFADVAAEALGNLMLVSVGCDPSLKGSNTNDDSSSEAEADESDLVDTQAVSLGPSSVAKSMERGWPHLMNLFPWAKFLSDGAFKRVYKVWNNQCGAYEALSVMDVNAIDDMGNLDLVGTELAVSVILSSVARRNICPNFVITRGVFTCQHEPPASLWGCKNDSAPRGGTYDGHSSREPTPGQCGNYQYIRMELCENGDVEEFMRNHPDKMLAPWDCRNLLFQMTFALHVAGDRFGLKHYDVKLLNFLLQSAKDPTIDDEGHPHVALRYGVGSHVFRLRMHPSTAHIAKLADYGTSVMRTDMDSQPVSLGQFTTLENTPPEYLILGNAAEQGYGHDCFGLGLCVLHLFTGHGPYEEILDDVVCPENLKGKLRKIWKQKSHDVIHSVISAVDENEEDETLYNTLYRYLVLFGIPEKQFSIKKHGKVWRAINATLLSPRGPRSKKCPDIDVFNKDRKKFSLADGSDKRIAAARCRLLEMDGAMELLLSLVSFDPNTRATPLDVINSRFMTDLIEDDSIFYCEDDIVKSYTAYAT